MNVTCKCYIFYNQSVQWSPTEADVFASCSVDGNIAIWDIRIGKAPAASIKAHNADVNVLSWNGYCNISLLSVSTSLWYVHLTTLFELCWF